MSEQSSRVLVLGGGIAGISAATVLAERGVPVTLIEKEKFLGGRAGSWQDQLSDNTPFQMERGFHAFFRQYHNLRSLLRRVDPDLHHLTALDDYPLVGPTRQESFKNLPTVTPFNVMELVRRTPTIKVVDLFKLNFAPLFAMLSFDASRTYEDWDRVTAKDYLDSLNFPVEARDMLFSVFAHSFFNPEEDYSAAELLAMFHFYFLGNTDGLVFDVCNKPFGEAYFEPLGRYLEGLGVEILRETSVAQFKVMGDHEAYCVTLSHQGKAVELTSPNVIFALNVSALKPLVDGDKKLSGSRLARDVASLACTNPFAVLRLWIEHKVNAERMPFAGTTGFGILDNISIYEKLENESAAWSQRTGGSVVELHAYGLDKGLPEDAVRAQLLDGLYRAYPETQNVRIVEERFIYAQDCPAFQPGMSATRPAVETQFAGLSLAGDFVRLPYPSALMEKAATSGMLAAANVLRRLGHIRRVALHTPSGEGIANSKGWVKRLTESSSTPAT